MITSTLESIDQLLKFCYHQMVTFWLRSEFTRWLWTYIFLQVKERKPLVHRLQWLSWKSMKNLSPVTVRTLLCVPQGTV
jgi:hypothetical protein